MTVNGQRTSSKATMLVIEDEPDIADLLGIHLSDLGYALDRAVDGKTGLDKALHGDYALVILDLISLDLEAFPEEAEVGRRVEPGPVARVSQHRRDG